MNKKIILSTLLVATFHTLNADFLGAEAGYAIWNPSLSGTIKGGTSGELDIQKDLGFSSSNNSFFWAYLDHPIPLLPNIKIQQTNYTTEASKNKTVSFFGNKYEGKVTSELTLNQTDIIAYWRILDNWVNFDIGIDIKNISANIKINSASASSTNKDFSVAVPMIYAKARFDLPFSGLSIEADIAKVSYGENELSDIKAAIVYEFDMGLGTTIGMRNQKIVIEDVSDIAADIQISGAYASVFYHF